MSDTATKYLIEVNEFIATLPPVETEGADWIAEIKRMVAEDDSDAATYMRIHGALGELSPLIGLSIALGQRDTGLVRFYDFFQKQQEVMGDDFDYILEEAKSHAGL